jgi:membrane protein required for colicin V production
MIYKGQKDGFVSQLLGLIGICIGVFLALSYGEIVGSALRIDQQYSTISGFIIVLLATIILIFLVSKLITKTLSLIKLGWLNTLLGIVFALFKGLLVLSLLYAAIFALNTRLQLVEPEKFDSSVSFNIVRKAADPLIDYWEQTKPIEKLTTPEA